MSAAVRSGYVAANKAAIAAAVPRSDQCSSFRSRSVHDRSHIIHSFLERGRTEHRIRDTGASLIEEEDARDRGERSVVVPPALELPAVVDVGEGTRNDHEVEWPRAEHLVPDIDVPCCGRSTLSSRP